MSSSLTELCGYTPLAEPDLLFHGKKTDKHPLRGLIENGPYSLRFGAPSCVSFALLAPSRDMRKLVGLVEELNRRAKPREAVNYYPEYPGFAELFSQDGATNHLSRSSAGYAAIEKPAAQSRMRKGLAAND